MMGTATASLLALSSAAWPPRLKIPTLYPVLPRFRVGIAVVVAGLEGCAAWARATSGSAAEPSAAAVMRPPALRKVRRLLGDDFSRLLMPPPASTECIYINAKTTEIQARRLVRILRGVQILVHRDFEVQQFVSLGVGDSRDVDVCARQW